MFLVYLGVILGNVVSKVGKITLFEKILTIMNMPTLKMPKGIQVFNGMA
jgi:hypothetical protein